ncbi:MAG: hypothetical protein J5J06_20315 [Phycisphaerae bacterium]|nr:hypothetical protein [Phycisphaerae bacterium]
MLDVITRGGRGPVRKSASVTTNDPRHPRVALTCGSRVRNPFRGGVPIMDFGRHEPGDTVRPQQLMLMPDIPDGEIHPKVADGVLPGMEAKIEERKPGYMYMLNVSLGPPWPNGPLDYRLIIDTGVEEFPKEGVIVRGKFPQRFVVKQPEFVLPSPPAQDVELKTDIVRQAGYEHHLERVSASSPDLKATLEDIPEGQRLVISVPKGWDPPDGKATVALHSDDPELAPIELPITVKHPEPPKVEEPSVPCHASKEK